MSQDVQDYVAKCDMCHRNKAANQKPAGLLQPAGGGRLYALFKVTSGSIVKGVELLGVSRRRPAYI